jgi:hypothetical protein
LMQRSKRDSRNVARLSNIRTGSAVSRAFGHAE